MIETDAVKAENLEPNYLKINSNGTVPTLTAPHLSQPLIDTQPILEFLDQSRPSVQGPDLIPSNAQDKAVANALIKLVHSSDLETGLLLYGCLNDAEIDGLKSSRLFTYLDTRQSALENYLSLDSTNAFYGAKSKENGSLHRIFTNAPNADREAYFKETAAGYKIFAAGL